LLAAAVVASRVGADYGRNPAGDLPLWHEGSLELLDLLAHGRCDVGALTTALGVLVALGTLAAVVPYALLLHDTVAPASRRILDVARASVRSLPTLLASRIFFLGAAVLLVVATRYAFELGQAVGASGGTASDARIDLTGAAFAGIVLVAFIPLDLGIDACAAAVVTQPRPTLRLAFLGGFELVRRDGRRLLLAWTGRTLGSLALVVVGALLASRLGGRGGACLAGLWTIHQLITLSRTALRASWLQYAVRRASCVAG
jgi:hypothetical protein